jgi:hypothetical protein
MGHHTFMPHTANTKLSLTFESSESCAGTYRAEPWRWSSNGR